MFVGDELGPCMRISVRVSKEEGVDVANDNGRDGTKEEDFLPDFVATFMGPVSRHPYWTRGGKTPLEPCKIS